MNRSFYKIEGTIVCLETPLKEINDFCDYMWREFPCKYVSTYATIIKVLPYSGKKDCYSIYKNDLIAVDWGQELSKVPYPYLSKALENIVSGYAINQIDKQEMITLHSGALSLNDKGILILGESGNGKSTLVLELVANHNWLYLSDEVGLLQNSNHTIHPFLKTVSYTPGITKLNGNWITKQFGIEHQVAVPKEKYSKPTPLKAILFVKYIPEQEPSLVPIKKSESLVSLMNSQIGRAKSVATIDQMAEVVKKVNSYQILHNNAGKAANLIRDLIEKI